MRRRYSWSMRYAAAAAGLVGLAALLHAGNIRHDDVDGNPDNNPDYQVYYDLSQEPQYAPAGAVLQDAHVLPEHPELMSPWGSGALVHPSWALTAGRPG